MQVCQTRSDSDLLGWHCPLNHQIQIHPVSDLPFTLIVEIVRSTKHLIISSSKMLDGQVIANNINMRNVETHLHPYADSAITNTACLDLIHTEPGNDNNGLVLA
jgi:hypothetical protein